MPGKHAIKHALYFLFIILLATFLLVYFFANEIQQSLATFIVTTQHHFLLALSTTIFICILLVIIIGTGMLAFKRALIIKQTRVNLKKEMNDRLTAEENKEKLEFALLQGQKLQAIGTLAGGIAHDFNNILYAIIGYIELAKEDVEKNTQLYHNLGKMLEGARRGQELVSRILAFGRRQQHHFDILHITKTVEEALALLRPTIPASVIINFTSEIDTTILGNQTQIHQVLINIINNAVDAMEGEGVVDIKISRILADDPLLKEFPDALTQSYCKIDIIDNGAGMDKNTTERIFEPFFTTKEVGKGTGLGLSIVHSIIKEHQGEIGVTSKLGQGTHFFVLLPEFGSH